MLDRELALADIDLLDLAQREVAGRGRSSAVLVASLAATAAQGAKEAAAASAADRANARTFMNSLQLRAACTTCTGSMAATLQGEPPRLGDGKITDR